MEWNWYAMMAAAAVSFVIAIYWVGFELNKINQMHGEGILAFYPI